MQASLTTKEILERNRTTLNNRDLDAYLANQTDDVVFVAADGSQMHKKDIRPFLEGFTKAFPDGKLTFGEQVLTGDSAAVVVTFEGTNTGPLLTPNGIIEPTGKRVKGTTVSFLTIRDGKIASEHVYGDPLDLMRQLGLIK